MLYYFSSLLLSCLSVVLVGQELGLFVSLFLFLGALLCSHEGDGAVG